ncbi:MAG: glycosyltransferase family 4 protein [Bryobacterales bacterium]|nr:glycosyltransferase family 4 protein [Bryobacterales bacterium]
MKVLICHNYYTMTSGEDIVIRADINLLRAAGYEVAEYARNNTEIQSYNALQYIACASDTIYSRRTVREIKQVVEKERPDVALVQNVFPLISPSIYYALRQLQVPVIQLVYNYRLVCPNATLYTQGRVCERCVHGNYLHAVRYRCFRNSIGVSALYAGSLALHRHLGDMKKAISAYIVPDNFLKRKLVEAGYPVQQMFTMHNPFDVSQYSPSYTHADYFLFAGRIVNEKGIFTALRAFEMMPQARLVVVGGGEAENAARLYAAERKLSNVTFMGPRYGPDLLPVVAGARAVLIPSQWYDNCPVILQQAFACGKPVIASDIDGLAEAVTHLSNGLLFSTGDAADLAAQIQRLINDEDLRTSLGRNARRVAEEEFTSERRVEGLRDVIAFVSDKKMRVDLPTLEEVPRA